MIRIEFLRKCMKKVKKCDIFLNFSKVSPKERIDFIPSRGKNSTPGKSDFQGARSGSLDESGFNEK